MSNSINSLPIIHKANTIKHMIHSSRNMAMPFCCFGFYSDLIREILNLNEFVDKTICQKTKLSQQYDANKRSTMAIIFHSSKMKTHRKKSTKIKLFSNKNKMKLISKIRYENHFCTVISVWTKITRTLYLFVTLCNIKYRISMKKRETNNFFLVR